MLSDINQGDKDGQRFEKNSSLTGPLIHVYSRKSHSYGTAYILPVGPHEVSACHR